MQNSKSEALALILLILFAIALGIGFIPKAYFWFFAPGLFEENTLAQFNIHTAAISLIFSLFTISVHIGCFYWLFKEARYKNSNKWVWALLGLFSGIFSVILWYLKEIHELLKQNET